MIGYIKDNQLQLFKGNLDEKHPIIIDQKTIIITICT